MLFKTVKSGGSLLCNSREWEYWFLEIAQQITDIIIVLIVAITVRLIVTILSNTDLFIL